MEVKASQRNAIYQRKNNLVALPTFLKPSIKFQRIRLPNDQDLKFFNVRPPPKFCLINLFMSRLSPVTGYQNLLSEPTEVGTRTTLLSGLRCTNYATKTTIATTVLIVLLISLHMTSRLNRNKHGCFLLGKCVRTGANKLVVNGRNQEPLLLLRLASGASPAECCELKRYVFLLRRPHRRKTNSNVSFLRSSISL